MDATKNKIDSVQINGYPTIILYPADRSPLRAYSGPKNNAQQFIDYLKEKSSDKVDWFPYFDEEN